MKNLLTILGICVSAVGLTGADSENILIPFVIALAGFGIVKAAERI